MGICVSNELTLMAAPNGGANLSVTSSSANPSGAALSHHHPHSDRNHINNDRNHLELEDSFTAAARRPSLSSPPPLALPRFTVDANRPPMVLHRDGREASRPHPAPPQPHERGDQTASTAAVTAPRSVSLQDLSPDHNGARLSSHPAPPLPHHTGRSPLKRQNSSSRSRSHKRHAKNPLHLQQQQQQQQQMQSGTMGSAPFSPTLTRENDSCSFGHPPTPHPPQQDALQMSVTTTTTTTSSVSSEPTQRRRLPPRSRSFEQLQLQQQQLELDSRLPPIHNQPGGGGSPSFQRLPRPPSAAQQYPSGSMQQQLSHDSMQYSGSQQIEQPGSPFRPRPPPAGDPQQQHHHHPQQRHHHHHLVQQQSSSANMLSFSKLPVNSHPSVVQPPPAVGLGGGGGAVLTTTPLQHPAPPHTWYHPSPNLSHQNNNSEGYSYDENVSSPLTGTFPNREINNASFPTTNVRLEGTTTTTTNSSTTLTQHQMNPPLLNHPQPAGVVVPSSSPSSPRPPHSKLLRSPHQGVGKAKLSPLTVAMPDAGSFVTTLDPPSTPLLKGGQPLAPPPSSGRRMRPASYSNTTLHNVPPPIVHWMRYDPPLPSSASHSNTVTTSLSPSHRALFGSDDPLAASANQNAASSALLLLNPNWTAGGTVPVNGSSVPPPTMSPGCFSLAVYQEEGRSWLLEPTQQPQQGRSPQSQAVSSSNKIIVPQQQQMLPKEEPPLPRHMSSLCFAGANGQSLSDQESAGAISPSVLPLIQYCAFGES